MLVINVILEIWLNQQFLKYELQANNYFLNEFSLKKKIQRKTMWCWEEKCIIVI